ncbi:MULTISPECIES: murein biosynthesis integral membrane protein MurJ [Bosea]|uniref:murein biosynthesis integral membrane protein MurJ n=1 Tax=Bosea TaxID=85413 RepID=UPI00214FD55B|nr:MULTISPECIES: murein biosynthesis integral membrane protein MurJ [Bosea]MCR4521392.1 murein biosynthesis integral membrane protein MurJ [Bosea sp. 47.2.35]MDR6826817.1 putative peptidoglycan lipid II flippase [Bosea robiniae]MDR6893527.1 putative peptidoglycan lipid II flippase [Bosea sp. BE109]MDR7136774.1 putative peptidoglycan lipid II flippase [Bosea sp. BE168]MDR7173473.1 putative peptidoglycan lipid II flippase [Bosea sp. BE271]
MLKSILSVGGYTLISRITGFVRDIVLAAVLGAGAIMDAFSVALRLPNHFRAIFGEGAVNQAYVPTYALIAEKEGREAANLFADRLFTIQLIVQIVLLALALPLMPWLVTVLAPGFTKDPAVFELAVALTRITFPYLLFVTMVTFLGATLNAVERYAAFAAAPILLNVFIVAALAVPFLFPSAAHAAAWGVAISGVAQWILLYVAARRAGVSGKVVRPRMDAGVRHFLKVFGPAVIGSAGVQIAIFTDGIIASMLPRGGYAALYYAERLYQLPLGLIAIAVGTVALSAMSRAIARGDEAAANRAQSRAIAISLAASAPFVAAFVAVPEMMIAGLFQRGEFDAPASAAAGAVLFAYALGLPAIVMIRTQVSAFQARGDTMTPMLVALAAIACNVAIKLLLWRDWGAPGLALATAAGAWVNLIVLFVLARRRGLTALDRRLPGFAAIICSVAAICGLLAWWGKPLALKLTAALPFEPLLMAVLLVSAVAAVLYAVLAGGLLKVTGLLRLLR